MHELKRSGTRGAAELGTDEYVIFAARREARNGQLVLNLFVDLGAGACHLSRVHAHVARGRRLSVDGE